MNQIERLEAVISRLTPEQYAKLLAFAESLADKSSISDDGEADAVEVTETALLRHIQRSFPENHRQRLRELTNKSEDEMLSEAERAEYIALAEEREAADAERLQAVYKLAQLRGVSAAQVLKELGIGAPANG